MRTKRLTGVKAADEGRVEAVFARLGVKDLDGDVTEPGAFTDGQAVRISAFGHSSWGGALPIGKGTIHVEGDEAVLRGELFMSTVAGRETFEALKGLGELAEWSYSLHDVKSRAGTLDDEPVTFLESITVHEVSPVLRGAGVGTHTRALKSAGRFSEHVAAVVADVDGLIERAADVVAMRAEKGKGLGAESGDLLAVLAGDLARAADAVKALVDDNNDGGRGDGADDVAALLRLLAMTHEVTR